MCLQLDGFLCSVILGLGFRGRTAFRGRHGLFCLPVLLASVLLASPALTAQTASRITQPVDTSRTQVLLHHHPQWANPANSTGAVPANLPLNQFTLVLSRSPEQEQALEQLLADQQNPASSNYHHWLTPAETGERFGLSAQDLATITGWLQGQGLHVNWISPSGIFIGFGGTAADVGRAFQSEMRYYKVNGAQRISVSSDPVIPEALASVIKAVRGLYTPNERPAHHAVVESPAPQMTVTSSGVTSHFMAPADFATIYDVPASLTGAGITIGIVGWARTDFADFTNFRSLTGATFANPTQVVPTAYGGVDPGAAYTSPPSGNSSAADGQSEATLDVLRAGSTAPGASLLLVVSASSGTQDGIGADAQYLVSTSPVPAQVMSISFGDCESSEGTSQVDYWNSLFQTAAGEGISVFVASGDSGASGCDTAFSAPPANPQAISPNYICSSSYATCVGGTEFNDTGSPSSYWSSSNGSGTLSSALGYIPEGGWNESTTSSVAASGGGVSAVIPTPSWQTGTGVPTARAGRYTPDVAFSAAGHDGYFACFAAGGGSCVVSNNSYEFEVFSGTSAAAPSMAGVAALLDQKLAGAQGNLNPGLYATAANTPAAFHDVTVSSSGVTSCSVGTPSMCNNTVTSAQAGYLVGTGYDEVTGLGSLNVQTFINDYTTTGTGSSASFTVAGTAVSVAPGATSGNTSTITVTPTNGFTGTVALSCTITPVATSYPATCSYAPASVTISGTTAQTATMTVSTTAATTALSKRPALFWPSTGGAVLACVLLFGIPARRRHWRTTLGVFALLLVFTGGAIACGSGGGSGSGSSGGGTSTPGTTAGTYTITIEGTSGSTVATNTIQLTVQ
jgi:subtilase family serine protease